mmetsp:Transcript_3510/g.10375  ORF Transcript_3510/g.10375 Transcript_3510/m.10375 type:complete len:92 (+) Transcript_3510:250-525(+)
MPGGVRIPLRMLEGVVGLLAVCLLGAELLRELDEDRASGSVKTHGAVARFLSNARSVDLLAFASCKGGEGSRGGSSSGWEEGAAEDVASPA